MGELGFAAIAAARTADALLQSCGGRTVLLRMPAPGTAGDTTEQLGLAVPVFQDVPLAPAIFRKARVTAAQGKPERWELMISATAVNVVLGSTGYAAASVLFATAYGIVIDGVLMEIAGETVSEASGAAYVYRLVLRAPLSAVV